MILEQWLLSVQQIVNNTAYLWGGADYGELGLNSTTRQENPTAIGGYWKDISVGKNHTLAIDNNGYLYAWGINYFGQLGNNDTARISRSSPVQIGSEKWSKISTKRDTSFAIRSDGKLFGWGSDVVEETVPTNINFPDTGVVAGGLLTVPKESFVQDPSTYNISYEETTTIFGPGLIRSDGGLFYWGSGSGGRHGTNDTISKSSPVQVGTSSWTMLYVGNQVGAAIRIDGALFVWGNYSNGVGDGTRVIKSSPVQIGTSSWSFVGDQCAIRSDGALFTWGSNPGDNTTIFRSSPVQIGTSSWTMVQKQNNNAGWAIRSDGALFVWGTNIAGQLGTNDTISRSSPVQIGTSSWTSLWARQSTVSALRADGKLFTWGSNDLGALGDNTTINRSSPVQIGTSSWSFVAGYSAIRSDGALFAWRELPANAGVISGFRSSPVQIGTSSWTSINTSIGKTIDNKIYILYNGNAGDEFPASNIPPVLLGGAYAISPTLIGNSSWKNISAGFNHVAAIDASNLLYTWGLNNYKQVGTITPDRVSLMVTSPTLVGSLFSWSSVSSGFAITSAIRSDGALFTWGLNNNGQLGSNSTISRSSPVQVGTSSWSKVSSANNSMLAIRSDGGLFAWGLNNNGNLGTADTISRSSPVQIGSSSWTAISSSIYSGGQPQNTNSAVSAAIRTDGALFLWGKNSTGQLGLDDILDRSSPVQIGTSSWTSVSTGAGHSIAIRTDGGLFVWGTNTDSQLGTGDATSRSSPVQLGTSSWSVISATLNHNFAIRSDGALFAWGFGADGRLGTNDSTNRNSPVQLGTSSWTAVSTGEANALAIRSDGILFAWGFNSGAGNIGDNTTISRSSPVQIGTSSWTSVASGYLNSVAIKNNYSLSSFGRNEFGQIGSNDATIKSSPVVIGSYSSFPRYSWNSVSAGEDYTMAINSNGELYGWGKNHYGQTGIGEQRSHVEDPTKIGNSSWISVSAGKNHTLAIRNNNYLYGFGYAAFNDDLSEYSWTSVLNASSLGGAIRHDGALFIWGGNVGSGVNGQNDAILRSSPVQVGTSSWIMIAHTGSYALGITSDYRLFAWGASESGGLGLNDTISRSSPVQVGTSSWTQVYVGTNHTLAIRSDGALFAWGNGATGVNGQNDTISRSSPVQIGTSSWVSISVSALRACFAIRTDGALFAWGQNSSTSTRGLLGDNTITTRSSPVQIGTSSWSAVSSYYSTYAIRSDGALFTWGTQFATLNIGSLGLNDTISRSSPVQVGTSSWSAVSTTGHAIRSDGTLWWIGGLNGGAIGGINSVVSKSSPVQIGTSSWSVVGWTSAIRSDGKLFVWGGASRTSGILDDTYLKSSPVQLTSIIVANRSSPTQIGSSTWKYVSAGYDYNFAINSADVLYIWGIDRVAHSKISTPTSVLAGVTTADTGLEHSEALKY